MRKREHTVEQDDRCIKTRLFRVGETGLSTSVEISKDSNLRPIKEPKVFSSNGIEFLGPPPEQSIHNVSMLSRKNNQENDYTYNLEKWITVFCINPDEKDDIVDFFSNFGEISNVIPPSSNYISLEFVNSSDVDKILKKDQPILVKSGDVVICKRGKYTPYKPQIRKYPIFHYPTLTERIHSEKTFGELIHEFFHFIKWNFY